MRVRIIIPAPYLYVYLLVCKYTMRGPIGGKQQLCEERRDETRKIDTFYI